MNLLLIEDEERIANFILRGLRSEGWLISWAQTGEKGLTILQKESFDVILLDIMLPGISGLEVCSKLRRENNHTPILLLSALNSAEERVTGLNMGADDYLNKPFDFDELIARVQALARRTKKLNEVQNRVINLGSIYYDLDSLEVTCAGNIVSLTSKERKILQLFLTNPDRIYSRERILNSVWDVNEDPLTNVVDVYIGRLRKKLENGATKIETVRGAGYRMVKH